MTRKKYEKPLTLDVPFDEALERFANTDQSEVDEAIRAGHDGRLAVRGSRIEEDAAGNICLTDLWHLAGSPASARPVDWHRHKRTQALEAALQARMVEKLHHSENADTPATFYAGKGKAARSFAHPVLALDYAELLDPAIGVEVREVFLRFRAGEISLANDILDRVAEQVQEDGFRVINRDEITIRNTELAAQGAKAGCTKYDYAELHNSGYRGLYNGLDAAGIHQLKKLTKSQKILDHMNAAEGAANVFRVTQAKIAMQERKPKTPEEAFAIAHEAGVETRAAMQRIGGVMPEDMKPADGIGKAKKRLKENQELLESKKLDKKS